MTKISIIIANRLYFFITYAFLYKFNRKNEKQNFFKEEIVVV